MFYACVSLLHRLPSQALRGASIEERDELIQMYLDEQRQIREMAE